MRDGRGDRHRKIMVGVEGTTCLLASGVRAEELAARTVGDMAQRGQADETGVLTVGHGDEDVIVGLAPVERNYGWQGVGTEGQEQAFEKKTPR